MQEVTSKCYMVGLKVVFNGFKLALLVGNEIIDYVSSTSMITVVCQVLRIEVF